VGNMEFNQEVIQVRIAIFCLSVKQCSFVINAITNNQILQSKWTFP